VNWEFTLAPGELNTAVPSLPIEPRNSLERVICL
jgi:hypothetical protein